VWTGAHLFGINESMTSPTNTQLLQSSKQFAKSLLQQLNPDKIAFSTRIINRIFVTWKNYTNLLKPLAANEVQALALLRPNWSQLYLRPQGLRNLLLSSNQLLIQVQLINNLFFVLM